MNNDSLLSPANIAELATVSRPVVSNWRRRYDDFPEPVGGTDARPLFSRVDIITWLTNRNHQIKTGDTVAAVWASVNTLRGQLSSDDVETLVLLLLATRQYLPDTFEDIEEADEKSRIALLETAEEALRLKYPVNEEAREDLRVPIRKHLESIEAADLSPIISAVSSADTAQIREYADELIERFNRSRGRMGGTHGTIDSRASQLLVALAGNTEGTVYDPASGIADALIQVAHKQKATKLIGSEIDCRAVTIASLRTLLSGTNISYALGDVLESDPVPGLEADTIIAELPFGLSVDTTSMISDPRFSYGVPTRRGSELLWIQHALTHLAPGGRAYILTSHLPMRGGKAEQQIRANLLKSGCIEAVIALPEHMLPHTSVNLVLWVLRNPTPGADQVLMVDAEGVEHPEAEIPTWLDPAREVLPLITAPSESVYIADIIAGESILTPTRWIGMIDPTPREMKKKFSSTLTTLQQRLRELTESELSPRQMIGLPQPRMTNIGELVEKGVLERTPGRHRAPKPTADSNIVTSTHLRNKEFPGHQAALLGLPDETEPGDILIATTTGIQTMVDTEGGHQVATGVDCLRIKDSSVLLPGYLANVLRGEWNERFRTGMTIKRIPVQDLEIPLIPIADQQQVNLVIDQLHALQHHAELLIKESSKFASTVFNTVRHGVSIEKSDLN